jgi:hypothetical protein
MGRINQRKKILEREGRQKINAPTKILKRCRSAVLDNAVLPAANTAKKSCFAKSLTESVDKEGKIRINIQQARRFLRESNSDSNASHIGGEFITSSSDRRPYRRVQHEDSALRYAMAGSSPHVMFGKFGNESNHSRSVVIISLTLLHYPTGSAV